MSPHSTSFKIIKVSDVSKKLVISSLICFTKWYILLVNLDTFFSSENEKYIQA